MDASNPAATSAASTVSTVQLASRSALGSYPGVELPMTILTPPRSPAGRVNDSFETALPELERIMLDGLDEAVIPTPEIDVDSGTVPGNPVLVTVM